MSLENTMEVKEASHKKTSIKVVTGRNRNYNYHCGGGEDSSMDMLALQDVKTF